MHRSKQQKKLEAQSHPMTQNIEETFPHPLHVGMFASGQFDRFPLVLFGNRTQCSVRFVPSSPFLAVAAIGLAALIFSRAELSAVSRNFPLPLHRGLRQCMQLFATNTEPGIRTDRILT